MGKVAIVKKQIQETEWVENIQQCGENELTTSE